METIMKMITEDGSIMTHTVKDGNMLMHFPENEIGMPALYLRKAGYNILVTVDNKEKSLYERIREGDLEVDNKMDIQDVYDLFADNKPEEIYKILMDEK